MNEISNSSALNNNKNNDDTLEENIKVKMLDGVVSAHPIVKRVLFEKEVVSKPARRKLINFSDIIGKFIQAIVYLAVILMPIFVVPFNSEYWEIPKQFLLISLSFLGLILWLVKSIFIDQTINIRFSALDLAVFIFIAFSALSVWLGVDPVVSFLGSYGDVSGSWLGILSLGLFYFLIVNIQLDAFRLIKAFLVSCLIAAGVSLLWIFGFFEKILPASVISEFPVFSLKLMNTMGAANTVLIWQLGAVAAFIIGLIVAKKSISEKNLENNYTNNHADKKSGIAFFLPFIIIFLLVLNLPRFQNSVSRDFVLNNKVSWEIIQNKISSQNIKNILFGSGPANFLYDFSIYKPASFNQSANWNLRFYKSGSDVAEKIATIGIAGTFFYWLILIVFFSFVFRFKKNHPEFAGALTLFLIVAILNQVFNPQSFFSNFSFWLMLAAGSSVFSGQAIKTYKILDFSPTFRSVLSGSAAVMVIILLLGLHQIGRFYLADAVYAASLKNDKIENSDLVEKGINFAIAFNPHRFEYHTILSNLYLREIKDIIKSSSLKQDATKSAQVASLADKAIREAKKAVEIAPNNVFAFENLGLVYSNMNFLVDGANEWAGKSFSRALDMDPLNPVLLVELGKTVMAETSKAGEQKTKIDEAVASFQKAFSLKPDYYEAGVNLALAFEKKEETAQAIKILEEISVAEGENSATRNSEAMFHLGRLYYNSGRIEEAIAQLKKTISFFPNYSNARYSLGLAYERTGLKKEAKTEFEKVLELNPMNEEIKNKIKKISGVAVKIEADVQAGDKDKTGEISPTPSANVKKNKTK